MADAAARLDGAETPTVVRRRAANEKPRRVDTRRGASAPGQQARTSVATLALAAAVSLASRLRAAPCAPAAASLGPTSGETGCPPARFATASASVAGAALAGAALAVVSAGSGALSTAGWPAARS